MAQHVTIIYLKKSRRMALTILVIVINERDL